MTSIESSLGYLSSSEAVDSLSRDAYWPKWNSPWWHMLLLHEMGRTEEIPEAAVQAMVSALDRLPIKIFPLSSQKVPSGSDLAWDSSCHCAVGSMYSVLSAWGVSVERELPWLRTWLSRYQMADGGLNCDPDAYDVEGECPSSMVALLPCFEALLWHAPDLSHEEHRFLERCGSFLIHRKLMLGSSTRHNAEEREQAQEWLKPTFPRFYFYDVLRGLRAFLAWCPKSPRRVPLDIITPVLEHLSELAHDGQIRCLRQAHLSCTTRIPGSSARETASDFPLLGAVSRLGEVSPYLTAQWKECQSLLESLPVDIGPSEVSLAAPSSEWEARAAQEAERFGRLLGDNLVKVHHIGSTSIPNIWAKPVLDLMPEVHDVAQIDERREAIESAGYQFWGEYGLPGRRFCPLVDPVRGRVANIHCYQSGSSELSRHLAFRDYLRTFPDLAREYEAEKLRARGLFPLDVYAYNDEKNAWIRRTELDALRWADSK